MSWTLPRTWTTEVLSSTHLNTHLRDNLLVLRAGGHALSSQATNDLMYASSSTQWARIANGTTGQFLKATTSGAPSWSDLVASVAAPSTPTRPAAGPSRSACANARTTDRYRADSVSPR